jgi:curved DNA-binding protein CbpA
MEEDPYEILGVSKTATAPEIKAAYRKLALKHHPDKIQGDENRKAEAAQMFARIGAAYEILSDDQKRQEYDNYKKSGRRSAAFDPNNSSNDSFYDYEPFVVFHFGSTRRGFTDPFDLFRRVFADELTGGGTQSGLLFPQQRHRDMFFGGGSLFNDLNYRAAGLHNGGGPSRFSNFSSSSYSFGFGGGRRESVSTTTRIVNGRKVTRTERKIVHSDGTVEHHIETDGEEGLLRVSGEQKRPQLSTTDKKKTQSEKLFHDLPDLQRPQLSTSQKTNTSRFSDIGRRLCCCWW